jgi:AcrR family transcriptional regulator
MAVARHKSKNVAESVAQGDSKPMDVRVARTRELIDTAFVAMLHRRSYDGIRVGDITRKAGVARPTFYAHYPTKHDLLQSQLRRIVAPMITSTGDAACPIDATPLFAHLAAAPEIYIGLMSGASALVVRSILLTCFEERLQQLLPKLDSPSPTDARVPNGLVHRFSASSLLTLVSWCVDHPNIWTAAQTQAVYAGLMGGYKPRN